MLPHAATGCTFTKAAVVVGDPVPVKSDMRARLSTRPSFLKGVIPFPVMPNRNGKHTESF